MKSIINFFVNGQEYSHYPKTVTSTLLDFLRSFEVNLMGTKYGCGQGGCGACTVLEMKTYNGEMKVRSINSCLTPLSRIDGSHIFTIEFLSNSENIKCDDSDLPVQEAMREFDASQCGYCTPGFVVNMYHLIANNYHRSEKTIENSFGGNLCRCTGYSSILKAMKSLSDREIILNISDFKKREIEPIKIEARGQTWYRAIDINQTFKYINQNEWSNWDVRFVNGNTSSGIYGTEINEPKLFVDISTIQELRNISYNAGKLIIGSGVTYTELIEFIRDKKDPLLDPILNHLEQIAGIQVRNLATVGGALSLVKKYAGKAPAGIEAEPFPSDFYVVAMTYNGDVRYRLANNKPKAISLDQFAELDTKNKTFFIESITLNIDAEEIVNTKRIARRIQNSHPIVNVGFNFKVDGETITNANLIFGAISKKPFKSIVCREFLISKKISSLDWNKIESCLRNELNNQDYFDKKGNITKEFKIDIACSLFKKYYLRLMQKFDLINSSEFSGVNDLERNLSELVETEAPALYYDPAIKVFSEPLVSKFNIHTKSKKLNVKRTEETKGVHKIEADMQLSGKSEYVYDMHGPAGTLHAYYVYSEIGSGEFSYPYGGVEEFVKKIESEFSQTYYIHHKHIPNPTYKDSGYKSKPKEGEVKGYGNNQNGNLDGEYDPVFAYYDVNKNKGFLTSYGQPIGIVITDSFELSKDIANKIQSRIQFIDNKKGVYGLKHDNFPEERKKTKEHRMRFIEKKVKEPKPSFYEETFKAKVNDSDKVQIIGHQNTGAQIHFYQEPNVALAIPKDHDGLTIYSSSQFLTRIQELVSDLLNPDRIYPLKTPENKIIVKTKRLGGAFGGKELRPKLYAGAAAIAAFVLKRPIKLQLDRELESIMTGTRHPVTGNYYLEGDKMGKIDGFRVDHHLDIGNSWDCSHPVMELILLSTDGAYNIPKFKTFGNMYLTNIQSRTAFRSFGLVQCSLIREEAIEQYAYQIGKRADHVREMNFYADATSETYDYTPYGQPLKDARINDVWNKLKTRADFENRHKSVEKFNKENKWKKRGISIIPIKYGISYTYRPYNFGNAYVLVYGNDGSVLLHHGGIEMGQGLNTKMLQIASEYLGIDLNFIRIAESGTDKIPNAPSTGASTGSDLNGGAVINACIMLRDRLVDFLKEKLPLENSIERITFDGFYKETLWGKKNESFVESFKFIFENVNKYKSADEAFLDKKWLTKWNKAWPYIIKYALISRVELSVAEIFKSEKFGALDPKTGRLRTKDELWDPRMFYYFTYSAAVSEVEIDVLTGEYNILQTDIMYDAGASLNTNIDYGQIEGGFIQGVGYVTTENVLYDKNGKLTTQNTWRYKPPCSKTIPEKLNVFLLKYMKSDNPNLPELDKYGVKSSKSTGEPPLVLAGTVFFAIKSAIMSARQDYGHSEWVHIDAPLTIKDIYEYANCKDI